MAGKTLYWNQGKRHLQRDKEIDSTLLNQLNTGVSDWRSPWWMVGKVNGSSFPQRLGASAALLTWLPGPWERYSWVAEKIYISRGQRKSCNSKVLKVNALRKGRWASLQLEEIHLTFSPGWGGKTFVTLLTMGILGTVHSAFFHFNHFLSHHLILLESIFSSAFLGCFVLLTFILGLLSYAINGIIFKMICKTDLSIDDLCFVGGLGITAFIFRAFGVSFSHKLEPHH